MSNLKTFYCAAEVCLEQSREMQIDFDDPEYDKERKLSWSIQKQTGQKEKITVWHKACMDHSEKTLGHQRKMLDSSMNPPKPFK